MRVCVAAGGVPHCNRQRLSATKQLVTNPLNQLDPRALPKKEMSLNSLMQTKSPIRSNDDFLPGGTDRPVVLGNIGSLRQQSGPCVSLLDRGRRRSGAQHRAGQQDLPQPGGDRADQLEGAGDGGVVRVGQRDKPGLGRSQETRAVPSCLFIRSLSGMSCHHHRMLSGRKNSSSAVLHTS